jgi:hypothetical protein
MIQTEKTVTADDEFVSLTACQFREQVHAVTKGYLTNKVFKYEIITEK